MMLVDEAINQSSIIISGSVSRDREGRGWPKYSLHIPHISETYNFLSIQVPQKKTHYRCFATTSQISGKYTRLPHSGYGRAHRMRTSIDRRVLRIIMQIFFYGICSRSQCQKTAKTYSITYLPDCKKFRDVFLFTLELLEKFS